MTIDIVIVPCLEDNYAYLIHNPAQKKTCLIDVPEAKPIIEVLEKRAWNLEKIVLTHHHSDHVAGLGELLRSYQASVYGATADANRLPVLDTELKENDKFYLGNIEFLVMDVYGHTIGHIALYSKELSAVFSGDSLMTLGCGRLFEGSPEIMWDTLQKFCLLPPQTKIYSGHEYSEKNAQFALSIDPNNKKLQERASLIRELRSNGFPTVPSTIESELDTNPFVRSGNHNLKRLLGMSQQKDSNVLAELRRRRDVF